MSATITEKAREEKDDVGGEREKERERERERGGEKEREREEQKHIELIHH